MIVVSVFRDDESLFKIVKHLSKLYKCFVITPENFSLVIIEDKITLFKDENLSIKNLFKSFDDDFKEDVLFLLDSLIVSQEQIDEFIVSTNFNSILVDKVDDKYLLTNNFKMKINLIKKFIEHFNEDNILRSLIQFMIQEDVKCSLEFR